MDSTSRLCILCNEEFTPFKTGNQKYCTPEHQMQHYDQRERVKRKEIKERLLKEMWKINVIQRYNKFFEMFGKSMTCDICGCGYEENLEAHGVPLHPKLKEPIQDFRILDPKYWIFYCFKCYNEILFQREGTNK